jgi:DNA polymerase II large subunit
MDLAQTYAQKIATLLETPFAEMNLSNQHLLNALKPGEDGKPKNFTQVEQEVRGTSDWAKTNNAKETTNSVVNNILTKFGLM